MVWLTRRILAQTANVLMLNVNLERWLIREPDLKAILIH